MKKRILSFTLALALILALIPAAAPVTATAGVPGTYYPGDIAVINNIIRNNGLSWTPAPADGSFVPEDWGYTLEIIDDLGVDRGVVWSFDTFNKRVTGLFLVQLDLTGILDMSGLTELITLLCHNNRLTALIINDNHLLQSLYVGINQLTELDVSNNTLLESLLCWDNQLTTLDLNKNTALTIL